MLSAVILILANSPFSSLTLEEQERLGNNGIKWENREKEREREKVKVIPIFLGRRRKLAKLDGLVRLDGAILYQKCIERKTGEQGFPFIARSKNKRQLFSSMYCNVHKAEKETFWRFLRVHFLWTQRLHALLIQKMC